MVAASSLGTASSQAPGSSTAGTASSGTTPSSSGTTSSSQDQQVPGAPAHFALRKLLLGRNNPDGTPNTANGWKQYGFNLDGLVSTATEQGECIPRDNASRDSVHTDGNDGIDNAFGKHVMPILEAIVDGTEASNQSGLQAGNHGLLLRVDDLGTNTHGAFGGKLWRTAPTQMAPLFDGTDAFPLSTLGITNPGDPETALCSFPNGMVSNNVYSSGVGGTVMLQLLLGGNPLELQIHHARLAMTLDANHAAGTAGMLGGVLDLAEFSTALRDFVGRVDPSLCSGPTVDSILAQVATAADIMAEGTQYPSQMCDAITIGLGLEMVKAQPGDVNLENLAPTMCGG